MGIAPNHLVVVCGHAIWLGGEKKGHDESEWLIESYKQGETPTFIEHIKAGLKILSEDERSVLTCSGGPTWKETTLSEARSYANLAAANDYFNSIPAPDPLSASAHPLSPIPLSPRIMLEEQALDSYYNVLFSIVTFWRAHDTWPEWLTIVSHGFKRARIVDAHCAAICFPLDRVSFVGINPPNLPPWLLAAEEVLASGENHTYGVHDSNGSGSSDEKASAMRGVREVMGHWTEDPHGTGEILAGKRRARNPWKIPQRLFLNDEERARSGVKAEILADGTEALSPGTVPPPGTAWRIL